MFYLFWFQRMQNWRAMKLGVETEMYLKELCTDLDLLTLCVALYMHCSQCNLEKKLQIRDLKIGCNWFKTGLTFKNKATNYSQHSTANKD